MADKIAVNAVTQHCGLLLDGAMRLFEGRDSVRWRHGR